MNIKYDLEIQKNTVENSLNRLVNQTYKLLPDREEGADWTRPLETIIEEFCGMHSLLRGQEKLFFKLLCKLEGLYFLTEKDEFQIYRRVIFDCINVINEIKDGLV